MGISEETASKTTITRITCKGLLYYIGGQTRLLSMPFQVVAA